MFDKMIHPFAVAVAWVWAQIHDLLVLVGMADGPGVAWVISIILLTIIVRLLILPLFLRQIRSSRAMQAIQPELQRIQAKYKGKKDQASQMKQSEEMQALYKKHKVSPMASCLPLLVQMPVLFAMYRAIYAVKDLAAGTYSYGGIETDHLGPINQATAADINESTVMGVPLSHTITSGDGPMGVAVFVVLIIAMVALQFYSMRLSMTKNMPPAADPNNPMVQSQKTMLYVMPAMFIFSGAFFQMGVIVYMLTGSVWALAQSLWTIKVIPTPGSPAHTELVEKRQAAYHEWAKPFFADYDAKRAQLPTDSSDPQVVALNEATLAEVQRQAKAQKVASDFPESMTAGDKVSVYRNLSAQEWTTLPDEQWMQGVREATEKAEARRAQQAKREQAQKQSRQRRIAQGQAKDGASGAQLDHEGLSPEELERRRQERRKARRQSKKKRR
ncbi:membrane protein insertase YidC [Schaalia vaccimaxillae]|uniref:membrane protein insertase YidC n=1 Tax=Schaalia vaccimaxillae TaxID=183916 RepID=UPI0003B58E38|nr:membrane protein insertase YidC [Schaalia vaccimaxillae]